MKCPICGYAIPPTAARCPRCANPTGSFRPVTDTREGMEPRSSHSGEDSPAY